VVMRRSPSKRAACLNRRTGLLTYGWPLNRSDLPTCAVIEPRRYNMPLTVAGQWRIFTAFPCIPRQRTDIDSVKAERRGCQ